MASPFAAVDGLTPTDTLLASRASSLYDTASFDGEEGRVLALRSCAVLDTAPDRRFDIITSLAARLLGVPVCLVSLVDSNRLWFKSVTGPFGTCVAREGSFCSYITVPAAAEMLIVPDATKDARFSGNPFVSGPPDMRFYAGVPLVCSSQHRLGTLCIADFRPRYFSAEAYNLLCNLGEIVVRELERPAVEKRLAEEAAAAAAATADGVSAQLTTPEAAELPAACEPVALFTVSDPSWPLLYGNDAWTTACAAETEEGEEANAKAFWTVFEPINPALDVRLLKKRVNAGRPASVIVRRIGDGAGAGGATFRVKFMLAARDRLDNCVQVGIPGFVSAPGAKEAPEEVEAVQLSELWIATAEALTADGSVNGNSAENCAGTRRFARRAPARGSSALLSASSSSSSASGAAARQHSPPLKPAASLREQLKGRTSLDGLLPSVPPRWANLKLGPLLGQGGFGRVYRGELGEKPVAIKVLEVPRNLVEADRGGSAGTTAKQAVLEAALSVHLAHPSIVPTLDYVVNGGVVSVLSVVFLDFTIHSQLISHLLSFFLSFSVDLNRTAVWRCGSSSTCATGASTTAWSAGHGAPLPPSTPRPPSPPFSPQPTISPPPSNISTIVTFSTAISQETTFSSPVPPTAAASKRFLWILAFPAVSSPLYTHRR